MAAVDDNEPGRLTSSAIDAVLRSSSSQFGDDTDETGRLKPSVIDALLHASSSSTSLCDDKIDETGRLKSEAVDKLLNTDDVISSDDAGEYVFVDSDGNEMPCEEFTVVDNGELNIKAVEKLLEFIELFYPELHKSENYSELLASLKV
jgi:hypothetical protein